MVGKMTMSGFSDQKTTSSRRQGNEPLRWSGSMQEHRASNAILTTLLIPFLLV
jgi:hypothetical protein